MTMTFKGNIKPKALRANAGPTETWTPNTIILSVDSTSFGGYGGYGSYGAQIGSVIEQIDFPPHTFSAMYWYNVNNSVIVGYSGSAPQSTFTGVEIKGGDDVVRTFLTVNAVMTTNAGNTEWHWYESGVPAWWVESGTEMYARIY